MAKRDYCAEVTTSVSSSMFSGLMSMMLKLTLGTDRFHMLIRRSSDEMNVSWSEFNEILGPGESDAGRTAMWSGSRPTS